MSTSERPLQCTPWNPTELSRNFGDGPVQPTVDKYCNPGLALHAPCPSAQSSLMVSCYWVRPAQLHPWFKSTTLKRKSPSMSLRSESPSPVDEDDHDFRVKRPRRTTLTLGHTRPNKRKLPSCPQSPIEEEEDPAGVRFLTTKRQRCTTLEHEIERLSLTPPTLSAPAPEFATRLPGPAPAPGVPPDLRFSQGLGAASSPLPPAVAPGFQSNPFTFTMASPPVASTLSADALEDIKMRSSSWYEPEKDRACCLFKHTTPANAKLYVCAPDRDRHH